ncbi:MAG: PD-(D/E)XK nuclease-like domain-containing protein [Planctomycetota bacterium]
MDGRDAENHQSSIIPHQSPVPGIYPGLSFREYQAIDAVNATLLWTLKTRSPLHARYEREHPKPPTPALALGQALHTLILEPATFAQRYAIRPPCKRNTKQGAAIYERFLLDRGGREEIKTDEYETITAIAGRVRAQQCRELLCAGRAEVVLLWRDEKTGLLCKARLDYERSDGFTHYLTDLKSCEHAGPEAFTYAVEHYGYFLQAAYYCEGWRVLTGEDSVWCWLAVEKDPPWITEVHERKPRTCRAGDLAWRAALDKYAECVAKNDWPAYGGPHLIEMRDWALAREGVGAFEIQ